MRNSISLKTALFKTVAYSAIIFGVSEIMRYDASAKIDHANKFDESSLTEWTQSIFLLLMSIIYLHSFIVNKHFRPLSLTLASLSFCSFVREQDSLLDHFCFDGAWQLIVFSFIGITTLYLVKNSRLFLLNMNQYATKFGFGFFLMGFLTTYIFSRLYGRGIFWKAIMEAQYIRTVKNASEECIELFGYSILLIAAVEFVIFINIPEKSDYSQLYFKRKISNKNVSVN